MVQNLPSFFVSQLGQIHPFAGGVFDSVEKITSSSPHAAPSFVSHLWPLPSLYRMRKAFSAWLNVRLSKVCPVGSFLWDRLNTGQTFGDLMAAVLAEYDVGPDEAAADITEFLSELDAHKYLAIGEENTQ